MTDPIQEAAKQAAREAVAKELDAAGYAMEAEEVRGGRHDHAPAVRNAILGALAALDALPPGMLDHSGR